MKKSAFKILCFFCLTIFATETYAQTNRILVNDPNYDNDWFHFGFSVGFNKMDFLIINSDDFLSFNTDGLYKINEVYSVECKSGIGYHLGPYTNFRINRYFDIRTMIILAQGYRDFTYNAWSDTTGTNTNRSPYYTQDMHIGSTYLGVPILLMFKAKRAGNYRPYLVAGLNPRFDWDARKEIDEEEMPKIRLAKFDINYDVGVGVDFFAPWFKLGVELRLSTGYFDVLHRDDTQFSGAIKQMKSQIWQLSFNVE